MPTLRELQAGVRAALLGGEDGWVAAEVMPDGLGAAVRLQVYRNHVRTTLTAALRATFPVVARLVGDGFFAYAADGFIRRHPPAGPCLHEYGAGWPEFLAAFPPAATLPWLPDVARLEWAMNAAHHADDLAPADLDALRRLPPASLARLVLRLDPSLQLLDSPWPVDRIWAAHQPGPDPAAPVDLAAGGVRLEVRRRGDVVGLRRLDAASFALRRALQAGRPLAEAGAAALAVEPGLYLAVALSTLLQDGVIAGHAIAP